MDANGTEPKEAEQPVARNKSVPSDFEDLKFFVGGLKPDVTDDVIRKHFSEFGTVKFLQVIRDHNTGRNRGFCFVTMSGQTNRDKIFKSEHIINEKRVDVRRMQDEAGPSLRRKIFIGGVNPVLTDEEIQEYFEKFGRVEKVSIMKDGHRPRGFGFVMFYDEHAVKRALRTPVHIIDAFNKIEVRPAEARQKAAERTIMERTGMPPIHHYNPVMPQYPPMAAQQAYLPQCYSRTPYMQYDSMPGSFGVPSYGLPGHYAGDTSDRMSFPSTRPMGGMRGRGKPGYRTSPY